MASHIGILSHARRRGCCDTPNLTCEGYPLVTLGVGSAALSNDGGGDAISGDHLLIGREF
jgi:hypothetical protein